MVEILISLTVLIASIAWYVLCCRRSGTTLGKLFLKQSGRPGRQSASVDDTR